MNSRETLKNEQEETCMKMFLMALFIKAKKLKSQKQPKSLLRKQMNKAQYT